MGNIKPFVTVLTPVYNGEKYIEECIKSVISQDYDNWEYIIVNNCSTDSTADIAIYYSGIDTRIRLHNNTKFLDMIDNHNFAFSMISTKSKYCKMVSSDDILFPSCLAKLVGLAEVHPNVAIVGSYQLSGSTIRWKGIPPDEETVSGKDVCRKTLLEKYFVFGPPTSVLYRSDLIRENTPFFPNKFLHADTSLFYKVLKNNDLGFVHDVLSVERIHEKQASSFANKLHIGVAAYLDIFLEYGREYLSEVEYDTRKEEILTNYNYWLGGCILKMYSIEFWNYHLDRLRKLGYPVRTRKLLRGILREIHSELRDPKEALRKAFRVFICREKLE